VAATHFAPLCQCSLPSTPRRCPVNYKPHLLLLPSRVHALVSEHCRSFTDLHSFRFCARQLCSRVLGFPNLTAPNKRLAHFRSLSFPSILLSTPLCLLPSPPTEAPPTSHLTAFALLFDLPTQGQQRSIRTGRAGGGGRGRCTLRPALPVLPTYSCCHCASALWPLL
jgi:hypothetical protein